MTKDVSRVTSNLRRDERCAHLLARVEVEQQRQVEAQGANPVDDRVVEKLVERTDVEEE